MSRAELWLPGGRVIHCLQLGAGHSPHKRKRLIATMPDGEILWTTLDGNVETQPDYVFDLNDLERKYCPLPFHSEKFDELHMYSVIGLYGQQGNAAGFFHGMAELWRVLKPGGLFVGGTVAPNDEWAWGEPSAKRIINAKTFAYLTKEMYEGMGGHAQSDYRSMVDPCWWKILYSQYGSAGDCQTYHWVLRKEVQ